MSIMCRSIDNGWSLDSIATRFKWFKGWIDCRLLHPSEKHLCSYVISMWVNAKEFLEIFLPAGDPVLGDHCHEGVVLSSKRRCKQGTLLYK